jgi:hypothetical protein
MHRELKEGDKRGIKNKGDEKIDFSKSKSRRNDVLKDNLIKSEYMDLDKFKKSIDFLSKYEDSRYPGIAGQSQDISKSLIKLRPFHNSDSPSHR